MSVCDSRPAPYHRRTEVRFAIEGIDNLPSAENGDINTDQHGNHKKELIVLDDLK